MKQLLTNLGRLLDTHTLLINYHKRRLTSARKDMEQFGTETSMPVWCSERFQHHQRALRRLGVLTDKEFELQKRSISGPYSYRAFYRLLRVHFPDGYWSCSASGRKVVFTAPATQMPHWQTILMDFDQAS